MKNFGELCELEKFLAEKTVKNFNLEKKELKNKLLLGLLVEIGELANITMTFKFWSTKLPGNREEILDEYTDGLHFVLSAINDLNVSFNKKIPKFKLKFTELTDLFLYVFNLGNKLYEKYNRTNVLKLFSAYLYLGEQLGFTDIDITNRYKEKNKIDNEYQDNGY